MPQRILIIGASGQVGREMLSSISESVEILPTYNETALNGGTRLDVLQELNVIDLVLKFKPNIIINLSALTNVDRCEVDKDLAYKINAMSVKFITRAAMVNNSYLVHVSTDYVFDGEKGMYKEDDFPNPINYYGLTKLIGETFALSYDLSLVVRTSGVFGGKSNFPKFVMDNLKKGNTVKVIKDSFYSPISAKFLAKAILDILSMRITGIMHIAGERISREDLAKRIGSRLGKEGLIDIVNENEMKWKAKRPRDSSLDISKAKKLISFNFYDIDKNLDTLGD